MATKETVICIGCPLGCHVTVTRDKKGKVTGMKNLGCKKGEKYVLEELRHPVRTLTATVRTSEEDYPLLPVRTSKPVLKTVMRDIMKRTAKVKVKPPVKAGDVIVKNVSKSGADLVATADWPG